MDTNIKGLDLEWLREHVAYIIEEATYCNLEVLLTERTERRFVDKKKPQIIKVDINIQINEPIHYHDELAAPF